MAFAAANGTTPPSAEPPLTFLSSAPIVKAGLARARDSAHLTWRRDAFLWWLMFVFGELGQAVGFAH